MIRLHDSLISGNGYKVRLLVTQLGIPFERAEYDLASGETRTPGIVSARSACRHETRTPPTHTPRVGSHH